LSETVIIRDARREDLETIAALIHGGIAEGTTSDEDPGPPLPASYLAAFEAIEAHPSCRLLVAERDGRVAGTFSLAILPNFAHQGRPVAQIESVHVAADLRSHGIGEVMVRWAIAEAEAADCVRLQLTSNKKRTRAHDFYRRLGFVASHEGMKRLSDADRARAQARMNE
jgi:GNAT superfamily N-acetyltransferase